MSYNQKNNTTTKNTKQSSSQTFVQLTIGKGMFYGNTPRNETKKLYDLPVL